MWEKVKVKMKRIKSPSFARAALIWIMTGSVVAVVALETALHISAQKSESRMVLAASRQPHIQPFSQAPVFSPYSDFQAMNLEQLKTLQVKLTYVGAQNKGNPSLAFTSSFNTLDLSMFVPFRRPNINYSNDDSKVVTFTASPEELKAVIDNVAALPNVTAGGVATEPFLSFGLLNNSGGIKAFESVMNQADALAVFSKLRLALQANNNALRRISEMACRLSLLEMERPSDVSTKVNVSFAGVRLNRTTGRLVGTATVKNTSADSISGPISLVLDFQGSVDLINADGTTCGTTPRGREFINLQLSGNVLPPGGSVQVQLEYASPDQQAIKPTVKVLAGPGAR